MGTRKVRTKAPARAARPNAWSGGAHALATIGTETARAVEQFVGTAAATGLFKARDQKLRSLAAALEGWSDDQAAKVVARYLGDSDRCEPIADQVCAWVRAHRDSANNVFECMAVDPPDRV